jgi:TIR domain
MDFTFLKKHLSTNHILRLLLLYVAGVFMLVPLSPFWREADMGIYGALLPPQKNALRSEIVLVDIDRPDGQEDLQFRTQLAELLGVLSDQLTQPPKAVLLDVHFLPGNNAGIAALIDSIGRFRNKNKQTKLYATLPALDQKGRAVKDAIQKGEGEVARLYGSLDGFGHTEFRRTFSGKVIYYVPDIGGIRDFVSIAYYDAEPTLAPHTGERVIRLGPPLEQDSRSTNLLRFSAASNGNSAKLCAGFVTDKCVAAEMSARRDWIIIGSVKHDRQAWGISGPETVAWALNDLVSPNEAGRPQPVAAPGLLIALVLMTSLLAWGVFLLLFRLLKTPPSRLWMLGLASFAAGCCLLAAVAGLFWMAGKIFPQMSAVLLSVILGTAIGRLHVKAVLDDALLPTSGAADVQSYYDVFISYSHDADNVAWVNEHIYQPLLAMRKADGQPLRIFFDKSEISAGMLWFRKLAHSIQESAVFLPVYSRDYFQRGYCLWESEVAQRKLIKLLQPNETTTPAFAIFPLQKDGTPVPPPYDGLQFVTEPDKILVSIRARFGSIEIAAITSPTPAVQ